MNLLTEPSVYNGTVQDLILQGALLRTEQQLPHLQQLADHEGWPPSHVLPLAHVPVALKNVSDAASSAVVSVSTPAACMLHSCGAPQHIHWHAGQVVHASVLHSSASTHMAALLLGMNLGV